MPCRVTCIALDKCVVEKAGSMHVVWLGSPFYDISCRLLDGCCLFLKASGWLLVFCAPFWMVAVNSSWLLNDCFDFLEASWLLLILLGSFWMVAVISWRLVDALGCMTWTLVDGLDCASNL